MIYVVVLLAGLVIGYLARGSFYKEPKKVFLVRSGYGLEEFMPIPGKTYVVDGQLDECVRTIEI